MSITFGVKLGGMKTDFAQKSNRSVKSECQTF